MKFNFYSPRAPFGSDQARPIDISVTISSHVLKLLHPR